jgi:hypothetical protein
MRYFFVALSVLICGCHSLGPDTVKGTHPLYNQAIVNTLDSQFLANLVRLRYRDTPYFLDVTSITNTVTVEASIGLDGAEIALDKVTTNFLNFTAGTGWSTQPTITFQPVEGEGFVKKFLTPISLDSLVLLIQAGWSLHRVFGLCVEQVNGIRNSVTASGPTPKKPPLDYARFNRLITLLDDLRTNDAIRTAVDPTDKSVRFELKPMPGTAAAAMELKSLLELDSRQDVFQVTSDMVHQNENTIALRTRSPLSVLFYLSQSVEAPQEHIREGLVTVTRNSNGTPFAWSLTPAGGRFKVRSSTSRPESAFTAVPYRDHWFYLDDSDLESKSSFMLMSQVFRLQAGTVASVAPVLTIPVRR